MNTWQLSIARVEARKRLYGRSSKREKAYFVYVISVLRTEAEELATSRTSTACCSLTGLPSATTAKRRHASGGSDFEGRSGVEKIAHPLGRSTSSVVGGEHGATIDDDDHDHDEDDEELTEAVLERSMAVEFAALSQLPRTWQISRSYDDFYVFEARLREASGPNARRLALLPDRKIVPRTRAFLESQQPHLEAFIQVRNQPTFRA